MKRYLSEEDLRNYIVGKINSNNVMKPETYYEGANDSL